LVEIKTIPNDAKVSLVKYSPPFSAVCAIGQAPFSGVAKILYWPKDTLLEFESFEAWLREQAQDEITIEGFCRLVFDTLQELLGKDVFIQVTIKARTIVHAKVTATIESTMEEIK